METNDRYLALDVAIIVFMIIPSIVIALAFARCWGMP